MEYNLEQDYDLSEDIPMTNFERTKKELTLLLLYLNSWEETVLGEPHCRSWKGYDFDDINQLSDEGLIFGGRKSKSIYFRDSGIELAKSLMDKYGIDKNSRKE